MSFLGNLPMELILKIFHMATFDGPDCKVPLALSHVSRDCRAIVSSEAHLWTTIKLDNKSAVGRVFAGANAYDFFPSLYVYLCNSRQLPLNISIDYVGLPRYESVHNSYDYSVPCTDGFTLQHAAVLGMILLDHVYRLERFTVRTESWEIYTIIVDQLKLCHFRAIKSWDVEYGTFADLCLLDDYPLMYKHDIQARESILTRNSGGCTAINELAELGQRHFPSLRRLRLNGTPHGWFFSTFNLVELVVQNMPMQFYRANDRLLQAILSNSRHTLQVLELTGCLHATVDHSTQKLSLPAVHTLTVGFSYIEEMSTLLRIAGFPALTDLSLLHLEGCLNEQYVHQCEMVEIFRELTDKLPLHQLTSLYINAISFPREDLLSVTAWGAVRNGTITQAQYPVVMRFISELTALQTLRLVQPDPLFLQSMNYSPPSSMLFLPSLKKLRFETSVPKDCMPIVNYWGGRIAVLKFLSGGTFTGPGLERLELVFPDTQESAKLTRWTNNPQPYAISVDVEFQPQYVPYLVDEDDEDDEDDEAMEED